MGTENNPLGQFLEVPGAKTALAVSAAKAGFSFEFVNEVRKHGNLGQGIYVDPGRDVVGVYFSTYGYISPVNDTVVAWFCTSDGSNHEGTIARAIVKRLKQ